MNNKLIIILFCLCHNLALGSDTLVAFHGSKIKLPQGFIEFSDEQLATFKSTLFDRQLMTVYEKKGDGTELKRIVIYYDSLSGTKNITFKKNVDRKLEVIKESGITYEDIKIDESNHCVYGRTIILGDTSLFGFSIDAFGIMGIQFGSSNGISIEDKENFENLMTTIKHGSPYFYVPKENQEAKEAKKEMERRGLSFTLALLTLILIWLIRKYANKND